MHVSAAAPEERYLSRERQAKFNNRLGKGAEAPFTGNYYGMDDPETDKKYLANFEDDIKWEDPDEKGRPARERAAIAGHKKDIEADAKSVRKAAEAAEAKRQKDRERRLAALDGDDGSDGEYGGGGGSKRKKSAAGAGARRGGGGGSRARGQEDTSGGVDLIEIFDKSKEEQRERAKRARKDAETRAEREEEVAEEEGVDLEQLFRTNRLDLNDDVTMDSQSDGFRAREDQMWALDELKEGDGVSSTYTMNLPEVAKPTEANLAIRGDSFMQFLSLACGHMGRPLVSCFVMTPPPDCADIEQYMPFLHPTTRSAAAETNGFVKRFSGGHMSLQDCIQLDRWDDLLNSSSRLFGAFLRKTIADNPLQTIPTRFASAKVQQDMNNALRQMFLDIRRHMAGRGGGGSTARQSSTAMTSSRKYYSTDWMHVT